MPKLFPCNIYTPSFTTKEYSSLRINNSSAFDEYKKHSNDLFKQFVEKEYKENIIQNQIEKEDNLERSTLLNKLNAVPKIVIPFSVIYSKTLPNVREIINKGWHILNISNTFGNVLRTTKVIAFRKNTSLRQSFVQSVTTKNF